MVAEVQKRGGIAGFIDAEHALDPVYAKNIGVDIDNLYISQPDTGEQGLEITETMVRSGGNRHHYRRFCSCISTLRQRLMETWEILMWVFRQD